LKQPRREGEHGGAAGGGAPFASDAGTRGHDSALQRHKTWRDLAGERFMSNPEERRIMEELDREVSRKGGLVALIVCLLVAIALVVSGTVGIVG